MFHGDFPLGAMGCGLGGGGGGGGGDQEWSFAFPFSSRPSFCVPERKPSSATRFAAAPAGVAAMVTKGAAANWRNESFAEDRTSAGMVPDMDPPEKSTEDAPARGPQS